MADSTATNGLTSQSWVQTPSRKKTPRAVSSIPEVVETAVPEVDEFEVATKAPKLDKMDITFYEQLMALCAAEGITPTTLMEGVLTVLEEHPEVKGDAIQVAKERRRLRTELGKRRRIQTEMQKMQGL